MWVSRVGGSPGRGRHPAESSSDRGSLFLFINTRFYTIRGVFIRSPPPPQWKPRPTCPADLLHRHNHPDCYLRNATLIPRKIRTLYPRSKCLDLHLCPVATAIKSAVRVWCRASFRVWRCCVREVAGFFFFFRLLEPPLSDECRYFYNRVPNMIRSFRENARTQRAGNRSA